MAGIALALLIPAFAFFCFIGHVIGRELGKMVYGPHSCNMDEFLNSAPIDDEPITEEDFAAIAEAKKEMELGHIVKWSDIKNAKRNERDSAAFTRDVPVNAGHKRTLP